ncbi:MAG TPA: sigma-70 family RNA polymerase sigma factor [Vicinamibacterales bacterium]|nr:sigma-70 family RNA polymerase sigma factor [Vicinamibacterales bacterium]
MATDDLGELMRAAQQGDTDAYLELLRAITPHIRRVVARRGGFLRPEDVEDLVQDVLISVHRVRATYDPTRPFLPWLLAIVRNRVADGARRYARTMAREVQVEDLDVTPAGPAPNSQLESSEDMEALRHAVRSLPPGQRQAIELLKLRELSLKEAASAAGTSVGALKVATHRAIAALRRALRGSLQRP